MLRKNIGGVSDADIVLDALQSSGQPSTDIIFQTASQSAPMPVPVANVAVIADPMSATITQTVLPLIGIAGIVLGYQMLKKGGVVSGKKKRGKLLMPLLLAGGIGAVWYLSKKNAETDLVIVPGTARLSDSTRDAVFSRGDTWVNPNGGWYPGLYRDVLKYVLPAYASKFDSMTDAETQTLYSLVIDNPQGVTETTLYNELQALKNKYKLVFY